MRLFFVVLLLLVPFVLGACTTISNRTEITQQEQQESLPIKRLSDALVERFTARGWAVKLDPARNINHFAHLLTKGFGSKPKNTDMDPVDIYLSSLEDRGLEQTVQQAMLNEILLATAEVRNLTNSVDKSHVDSGSGSAVRMQMLSLEQAVLTTRKARKLFAMAAKRSGDGYPELYQSLQELDANIEVLTHQANLLNTARQNAVTG